MSTSTRRPTNDPRARRRAEDLVDELQKTLKRIEGQVPELVYLETLNSDPDGFTSNTGSDVSSQRRNEAGQPASTTEVAALLREEEIHRPDLVAVWIRELFDNLYDARKVLRRAGRLNDLIAKRARQDTGGTCTACFTPVIGDAKDRLRSGLCEACFKAWGRWRASEIEHNREPTLIAFRAQRTRKEAS